MSRRQPAYVVEVIPSASRTNWVIDLRTSKRRFVVHACGKPKVWIVAMARTLAKIVRAELVIKGRDGRILQRDSEGADSPRRKG